MQQNSFLVPTKNFAISIKFWLLKQNVLLEQKKTFYCIHFFLIAFFCPDNLKDLYPILWIYLIFWINWFIILKMVWMFYLKLRISTFFPMSIFFIIWSQTLNIVIDFIDNFLKFSSNYEKNLTLINLWSKSQFRFPFIILHLTIF